jgi:hypothetical protein
MLWSRPCRRCSTLLLGGLILLGGCASLAVGGALGFDAGTLGADGVATGLGGELEMIGFGAGDSFGIGPVLQLAGYNSSGDGDPIAFTTVEGRYRGLDLVGAPAYFELGTGLGAAWSPDVHHVVVPLHVAIGSTRRVGDAVSVEFFVRERFLALVGSGSPPLDAFNSVQVGFGLRVTP